MIRKSRVLAYSMPPPSDDKEIIRLALTAQLQRWERLLYTSPGMSDKRRKVATAWAKRYRTLVNPSETLVLTFTIKGV